jgi:hypothetical protein
VGILRFTAVVCLAALALVPAAFGASAQTGYSGIGGNVQSQVEKSGSAASGVAGLPFTGLDLALIVGGGLALVLAGGTIRRLSTRRA